MAYLYFIKVILLLWFIIKINSQIFTSEYSRFSDGHYLSLLLTIGDWVKVYYMKMGQSTQESVFCFNQGQYHFANISTEKCKIQGVELECKESTGHLSFNNNRSLPYPFYFLVNKSDNDLYCSEKIPLAFKFNKEKMFLILQLKNRNYIKQMVYYLVPNKNDGLFYFGGILSNETKGKYLSSYKVNKQKSTWSFKLTHVIIDNNSKYDNYDDAYFDISELVILTPIIFMDFLRKSLFKELLEINECGYVTFEDKGHQIFCIEETRDKIKDIMFVFDNKIIPFQAKKLFNSYEEFENKSKWRFKFLICSHKDSEIKNFVFGGVFLKNFISGFDYDNSMIYIYSDFPFELYSFTPHSSTRKFLFCVSDIIHAFGIYISLIYIKNIKYHK